MKNISNRYKESLVRLYWKHSRQANLDSPNSMSSYSQHFYSQTIEPTMLKHYEKIQQNCPMKFQVGNRTKSQSLKFIPFLEIFWSTFLRYFFSFFGHNVLTWPKYWIDISICCPSICVTISCARFKISFMDCN